MKKPLNLDDLRMRYDALKEGAPVGDLTAAQMRALYYPPERFRLFRLMKKVGETTNQKRMADIMDVSAFTWRQWEKGRAVPSPENLSSLLFFEQALLNEEQQAELRALAYPPEEKR